MPTARLMPTYYRVSWTGNAPTDYNALTGEASGGIDNCAPEKYLRIVRAVGAQAAPTVTNLDQIRINGVTVEFTTGGGLNLAGIINTINAGQTEHNCVATESPATYLTILNAAGYEGYPIQIEDVTGGVVGTKLGLQETVYVGAPLQQGGTPTLPLTDADNVLINGVTITFTTAGGLDITGVVATINASAILTNVSARVGGGGIILVSDNGQPFTLTAGSTANTWSDLGFTVGAKGGSVVAGVNNMTLVQSLAKERANLRWEAVVFHLGELISPTFLGEIVKTGNQNGTAPVTTLNFTVAYDRPTYLSTEDELTPGVTLTGTSCIRRLMARALTQSYDGVQEVFDPTLTSVGNASVRVNPLQIINFTSGAIDAPADVAVVEANITVTQINQV
jgi:hypothetical protein